MERVLVGISGGVDSAVTAHRLKKAGYDVIGIHIKVLNESIIPAQHIKKIAEVLDIPIFVVNAADRFENIVLKQFKEDHLAGRTPSPCVICNPELKWKTLLDLANIYNADFIASGHYIRKEKINGLWYLKCGTDDIKDQSYFLWRLTQPQLEKMHTPLGELSKQEVKTYASKTGLDFLAKQKESTGLCFAQGLSYPELLNKYIPQMKDIKPGNVYNRHNELIGTHKGYVYYTIGQKRGITYFNDHTPGLSIVKIDSKKNCLHVDSEESLLVKSFQIENCRFVSGKEVFGNNKLTVKVRGIGRNPEGFARAKQLENNKVLVELENPAWAMAPGQPVVFYDKDRLLGGGIFVN